METHSHSSLANCLRQAMDKKGIKSGRALAKKAGVSGPGINKILRGETRNISPDMACRLGKSLGIDPFLLLMRAPGQIKLAKLAAPELIAATAGWAYHVTLPDLTVVGVNQELCKIWEIHNLGTTPLQNCQLVCVTKIHDLKVNRNGHWLPLIPELRPIHTEVPIRTILPQESVQVAVNFLTPPYPGNYNLRWLLLKPDHTLAVPAIKELWCRVMVQVLVEAVIE